MRRFVRSLTRSASTWPANRPTTRLQILERLAGDPGAPILVERGEWHDDYAEARNASFAMASSEILSWFDDDEVLEGGRWLRPLLAEAPVDVLCIRRIEVWRDIAPFSHFPERFVRADFFRNGTARWTSPVSEWMEGIPATARRPIASPARIRVIHHPFAQQERGGDEQEDVGQNEERGPGRFGRRDRDPPRRGRRGTSELAHDLRRVAVDLPAHGGKRPQP